ncbi:MAG: hypothetical protein ACKV19_01685 [Verrucomicrobiales bacterium]
MTHASVPSAGPRQQLPIRHFVSALAALTAGSAIAGPAQDAAAYADAIAKINQSHVLRPAGNSEADLAKLLPASARSALPRLLAAKPAPDLAPALLRAGEAALDLDLLTDFDSIRPLLETIAPESAAKLGTAMSRPRFLVRGLGKFDAGYLENFADVFDGILAAYDTVFGFKEFSKIPGKKLRVRVHLEPAITKPPHFAPEFPWHSEIDFPVIDGAKFASPTPQGQMLFYGLCHELGHVIAMWGDLRTMEDKHAWAHYTGVTIVEHLAANAAHKPWMESLRDARWRSLELERGLAENRTTPSLATTYGGVMALLIALHDLVGPRAIGDAINLLDAQNKHRLINHVRYYTFADFRRALEQVAPAKKNDLAKTFGK